MSYLPFTRKESDLIEKSLLNMNNLDMRSILSRCNNRAVMKELCYIIGCEYLKLTNIIEEKHKLTFGTPSICVDEEGDDAVLDATRAMNTCVYINKLSAMRRNIESCINQVIQNRINTFLFTSLKIPRYSKEKMKMEKIKIVSNLKMIEEMKIEDEKSREKNIVFGAQFVSELSDIHKIQNQIKTKPSENKIDIERLKQDYFDCNADMIKVIKKICGKKATNLFRDFYIAATGSEILSEKYISVRHLDQNSAIDYFLDLDIIEKHPDDERLMKLANF